jgi:predicted homoserine dehydrogenase-like protein
VALFGDAAGQPIGGPFVEVCAVAKRDLRQGETLDDYGHYMTYGEAANASEMREKRYLPEGLVEGCRLKRAIGRDQVITFDDVELPADRLADRLYAEQCAAFAADAGAARTGAVV